MQGFVSAGLLSVKQSRAGDGSGKSPNMHVAVAVRNMGWGFEKFPASWGPFYDLESLAREEDGHEWAEAETSRGVVESRAGGVASKRIILVGTVVPHASSSPFLERELSGRSVAVRRDLDVASMSGPSGLDIVGGQSMQHAGWQDCLRLASPRQVRHRVRRTWHRTLAAMTASGPVVNRKGGCSKPLRVRQSITRCHSAASRS